mmetsp:Transcript_47393/g.118567  ORF Transcript_47393/g.118567 Transcript_47393/m.118567 type:complete len:282 (-) Transcript_47393:312-1157(-)
MNHLFCHLLPSMPPPLSLYSHPHVAGGICVKSKRETASSPSFLTFCARLKLTVLPCVSGTAPPKLRRSMTTTATLSRLWLARAALTRFLAAAWALPEAAHTLAAFWLSTQSHSPSVAITTHSSPLEICRLRHWGSGMMRFLRAASPMALEQAMLPLTRLMPSITTTEPPAALMRCDSAGTCGLCSLLRGRHLPIRTRIAFESPAFAQTRFVPEMRTVQAVVPSSHLLALAWRQKSRSTSLKALVRAPSIWLGVVALRTCWATLAGSWALQWSAALLPMCPS